MNIFLQSLLWFKELKKSGDSFFFRYTHRRGVSCNKGAVRIISDLRITRLEYLQQMVRLFFPALLKHLAVEKKNEKRVKITSIYFLLR